MADPKPDADAKLGWIRGSGAANRRRHYRAVYVLLNPFRPFMMVNLPSRSTDALIQFPLQSAVCGHDARRVHAGDRRRAARRGRQSRIRIVHYCSQSGSGRGANSLKKWLLRLDSNQQPSGSEAEKTSSLAALCGNVLDVAGSGIVAARIERF